MARADSSTFWINLAEIINKYLHEHGEDENENADRDFQKVVSIALDGLEYVKRQGYPRERAGAEAFSRGYDIVLRYRGKTVNTKQKFELIRDLITTTFLILQPMKPSEYRGSKLLSETPTNYSFPKLTDMSDVLLEETVTLHVYKIELA